MDINSQQGGLNSFNSASGRFADPAAGGNAASAVPLMGAWACPKCGENNLESNRYCRKCGTESGLLLANPGAPSADYVSPKSGAWKWILIIFLILFLIGGAAAGWYFWNVNKQKKEARAYLVNESRAFSNTINLVNDLSTEKELAYKSTESKEVFLKKMEEEKGRSEKALAEIKTTREKNGQAIAGEMALGSAALLKQYYQEAEEKLSGYNSYISYECAVLSVNISLDKELDKVDAIFKNSKDPIAVSKSIRESQKIMQDFSGQFKALTPPVGLEEAHGKEAAVWEKIISSMDVIAGGLDKLSLTEVQRGGDLMDEALSDKNLDEIDQLREYYIDEMQKKFSSLRGKADNIKTEFIKTGAGLNAEIASVSIEGW